MIKLILSLLKLILGIFVEILRLVMPFGMGRLIPSILFPKEEEKKAGEETPTYTLPPIQPLLDRAEVLTQLASGDPRVVALEPYVNDELPQLLASIGDAGVMTDEALYRARL